MFSGLLLFFLCLSLTCHCLEWHFSSATLPSPQSHNCLGYYNNEIFIIGGEEPFSSHLTTIYVRKFLSAIGDISDLSYDILGDTAMFENDWTAISATIPTIPGGSHTFNSNGFACGNLNYVSYQQYLYLMPRSSSDGTQLLIFDMANHSYIGLSQQPEYVTTDTKFSGCMVADNSGLIYLIGETSTGAKPWVQIYNPNINEWSSGTEFSSLISPGLYSMGCTYDKVTHNIHIIGGTTGSVSYSDRLIYDIAADSWTLVDTVTESEAMCTFGFGCVTVSFDGIDETWVPLIGCVGCCGFQSMHNITRIYHPNDQTVTLDPNGYTQTYAEGHMGSAADLAIVDANIFGPNQALLLIIGGESDGGTFVNDIQFSWFIYNEPTTAAPVTTATPITTADVVTTTEAVTTSAPDTTQLPTTTIPRTTQLSTPTLPLHITPTTTQKTTSSPETSLSRPATTTAETTTARSTLMVATESFVGICLILQFNGISATDVSGLADQIAQITSDSLAIDLADIEVVSIDDTGHTSASITIRLTTDDEDDDTQSALENMEELIQESDLEDDMSASISEYTGLTVEARISNVEVVGSVDNNESDGNNGFASFIGMDTQTVIFVIIAFIAMICVCIAIPLYYVYRNHKMKQTAALKRVITPQQLYVLSTSTAQCTTPRHKESTSPQPKQHFVTVLNQESTSNTTP